MDTKGHQMGLEQHMAVGAAGSRPVSASGLRPPRATEFPYAPGPPDTAEYPRRILDAGMSALLRGPYLSGGAVVRPVLTDTVDKVRTIKFCAIITLVCCVKGNTDLAKTP